MKKIIAFVAATALTLASLTACGSKVTVSYDLEGAAPALATAYNIPTSVEASLSTKTSGLKKITIKDEDISVPEVSSMDVTYVEAVTYDASDIEDLVEALFEDAYDVRYYDGENMSKGDIQALIENREELIESYIAEGQPYENYAEFYDDIEEYEAMLDDAPDEYPLVSEYTFGTYIGDVNGAEYRFKTSEAGSGSFKRQDLTSTYRQVDGDYDIISYVSSDYLGLDDEENMCEMGFDEATYMAEEFLSSLGITEFALSEIHNLCWQYGYSYSETDDGLVEVDGYYFVFERSVNGASVPDMYFGNVENLEAYMPLTQSTESATIIVDENGVISANWTISYQEIDVASEEVTLLDWDALIDAMDTSVDAYYGAYPTSYKKVEFNSMELAYWLVATDTEGVYAYTPVWLLTYYETGEEDLGYTVYGWSNMPYEICIIDAVTGEFINIVANANAVN